MGVRECMRERQRESGRERECDGKCHACLNTENSTYLSGKKTKHWPTPGCRAEQRRMHKEGWRKKEGWRERERDKKRERVQEKK